MGPTGLPGASGHEGPRGKRGDKGSMVRYSVKIGCFDIKKISVWHGARTVPV